MEGDPKQTFTQFFSDFHQQHWLVGKIEVNQKIENNEHINVNTQGIFYHKYEIQVQVRKGITILPFLKIFTFFPPAIYPGLFEQKYFPFLFFISFLLTLVGVEREHP